MVQRNNRLLLNNVSRCPLSSLIVDACKHEGRITEDDRTSAERASVESFGD